MSTIATGATATPPDGAYYFGIALGLYPARKVMDCAFSLVCERRQHSFHASRRAPADRVGFDIAAQAESGLMSVTGDLDGLPQKGGVPTIDSATSSVLMARRPPSR